MKKNLFLFMIIVATRCNATLLTISQPGVYQLGTNITITPAASNDQIIRISASGVIIDFNGHVISQSNAITGIDGILIDSNLSDVTIQNGVVKNVTGNGLTLSSTTTHITIRNMSFENCSISAITTATVTNLFIQDINCVACCSNSTSTNVISLVNVSNSSIKNCIIDNTANLAGGTFSAITLSGCKGCNFESIIIQNCSGVGTTFNGINDQLSTGCRFTNVNTKLNHVNGNFTGLSTTSTFCTYTRCSSIGNTAGAAFNGFFIQQNANLCLFDQCIANNNQNSSGTGAGFSIAGSACTLIDCFASHLNNAAFNTTAVGFNVQSTGNANSLLNCIGSQQSDANTRGILVGSEQQNAIYGGFTIRNAATSDANSFGILDQTGATGNLYIRHLAFNNGATQANQLSGVPAGSTNTITPVPQTSNINNAIFPWSSVPVSH
jgi:hypothetical protein